MSNTNRKARGGKNVYGAAVGILMLESQFPRIPGDAGNAGTWPFPVMYKIIEDASPEHAVLQSADGLLDTFVEGARELVKAGAEGITTNCGFLTLFQKELASALAVPVASSSLMQVPWVQAILPPGKCVGVLTISSKALTPKHLECAGVPEGTPVGGTDKFGQEFTRAIIGDELELDVELARQDVIKGGKRLVDANPDIGAIVLECTNMVPYSANIATELDMPVYDFYSFVTWFQAGLSPRRF
jgi:hypothetical protein